MRGGDKTSCWPQPQVGGWSLVLQQTCFHLSVTGLVVVLWAQNFWSVYLKQITTWVESVSEGGCLFMPERVLLLAVSKGFYGNLFRRALTRESKTLASKLSDTWECVSVTRTGRAAMLMINECAVSCQACVSISTRLVAVETCPDATWISLILFLANWKFNKVTTAVPENQDRWPSPPLPRFLRHYCWTALWVMYCSKRPCPRLPYVFKYIQHLVWAIKNWWELQKLEMKSLGLPPGGRWQYK